MAQIFPPSWNKLPMVVALASGLLPALAIAGVWYFFSPKYTDAGYRPIQPGAPAARHLRGGVELASSAVES